MVPVEFPTKGSGDPGCPVLGDLVSLSPEQEHCQCQRLPCSTYLSYGQPQNFLMPNTSHSSARPGTALGLGLGFDCFLLLLWEHTPLCLGTIPSCAGGHS